MAEDRLRFLVLTPIPEYVEKEVTLLAPRPQSLENLTVGLVANWRPSAAELLDTVGELLQNRYGLKELVQKQALHGERRKWEDFVESFADEMAQRADVVITGTGD